MSIFVASEGADIYTAVKRGAVPIAAEFLG